MNAEDNPFLVDYSRVKYGVHPIRIEKLNPAAQLPHKENHTDSGFPLTLIGRAENRAEDTVGDVNVFEVGLKIAPPPGYGLEIVATSTLWKHGYTIPSSPIIIDPEDHTPIQVPLFKFKEGPDLELPYPAVILMVRKVEYIHPALVKSVENSTVLGDLGPYSSKKIPAPHLIQTEPASTPSRPGRKSRNNANSNYFM
jgi:hypothetical protein